MPQKLWVTRLKTPLRPQVLEGLQTGNSAQFAAWDLCNSLNPHLGKQHTVGVQDGIAPFAQARLSAEIRHDLHDAVAQAGNGHPLRDAPDQPQRVDITPDVV